MTAGGTSTRALTLVGRHGRACSIRPDGPIRFAPSPLLEPRSDGNLMERPWRRDSSFGMRGRRRCRVAAVRPSRPRSHIGASLRRPHRRTDAVRNLACPVDPRLARPPLAPRPAPGRGPPRGRRARHHRFHPRHPLGPDRTGTLRQAARRRVRTRRSAARPAPHRIPAQSDAGRPQRMGDRRVVVGDRDGGTGFSCGLGQPRPLATARQGCITSSRDAPQSVPATREKP